MRMEIGIEEVPGRARLIRYTTVAGNDHPNLLSVYDAEKNIQMIDRELAKWLPREMRNHLEMSRIPATMLSNDGLSFVPWVAEARQYN